MANRIPTESQFSTLLLSFAVALCTAGIVGGCSSAGPSTGGTAGSGGGATGNAGGGGGTTAAPGGTTSAPGGTTTPPGGTTAAPGGTTAAPGGTTVAGGTTSASGGATTVPGGTTSASGGTATAPGGTTSASGGATVVPAAGNTANTGGSTANTGGKTASSGGSTANSGGSTAKSGGSTSSGGKTGGSTASGGSSGGATNSGGATSSGGAVAGLPAAADILATMKLVIPYEIKLGPEDSSWVNKWTEATFYIGVMASYLATNEATFLTDATNWGTKNNWTLLASPTRSADNQCAGQVYEDIYLANPTGASATMYTSTKASIDLVKASPKPGIVQNTDDWWWCDALFMAPGGVVRLGKIANDTSYYSLLDTEWTATQTGLFDTKTGLFWRDSSYVNKTTYWSRGNGWVMGGIVRVLQYLPATDTKHDSYVTLLKTMAAAIVTYQQSDGTWHSDLTHPTTYNNPEVSGTGLITYALAYGINQGLLDRATYLPVVIAAWNGMMKCVTSAGLVGCIQATGSAPAAAATTETHDYGVGSFLLSASEIYNMVK